MAAQRWQNRIIEQGTANPAKLMENPGNWRLHPDFQKEALAGVLGEVGWVQSVIVNRTTGHIVDGHLRVELAKARKEKTIPVSYVELSEEEEAKILATFDPLGALAEIDKQRLDELLGRINSDDSAVGELLAKLAEEEKQHRVPGPSGEPSGAGGGRSGGASYVIQYAIIFNTEEEQDRWHAYLKWLKEQYPEVDTIAERLIRDIEARMDKSGE